jgi:hypothetical protein
MPRARELRLFRREGLKPRPLGRNERADPRNNALATLQEGILDKSRGDVCSVVHSFVRGWGLALAASEKQTLGGAGDELRRS